MSRFVITIARGFGSGGRTVGKMLAERLGIAYYDRELITLASEESGINPALFGKADESRRMPFFKRYNRAFGSRLISPKSDDFTSDDNLFNYQAKIIRELAEKESCVIVGRCADYVLRDTPGVVRVFVHAPMDYCVEQVTRLFGLPPKEAEKQIEKTDRTRSTYYRYYTGNEWNNAANYDLCLNTAKLGFDKCADIIEHYVKTVL